MEKSDIMEKKQFEELMNELKTIRKLLVADLYRNGVDSVELGKLTGMSHGNIRAMISKKKAKGGT